MAVGLIVAGIHAQENKLELKLSVPLKFLKKLRHQHGILAAGDADGDSVSVLNLTIFDDGAREGIEKIPVKMSLLQRKLDLFSQLFVLCLLRNGVQGPGTVSAGETLRRKTKILQLLCEFPCYRSVLAVQDDPFVFGKRGKCLPGRIFTNLLRGKQDASRNETVLIVALVPCVHQEVFIGAERIQLRGGNLKRKICHCVLSICI